MLPYNLLFFICKPLANVNAVLPAVPLPSMYFLHNDKQKRQHYISVEKPVNHWERVMLGVSVCDNSSGCLLVGQ